MSPDSDQAQTAPPSVSKIAKTAYEPPSPDLGPQPLLLGTSGGVTFSVDVSRQPLGSQLDAIVVSWDAVGGPGFFGRSLMSEFDWDPAGVGAKRPGEANWIPISSVIAAHPERPTHDLRGLIVATVREPADDPTREGEATLPAVYEAAFASTLLAQRHHVRRLGMPLLGAGGAALRGGAASDAVVSATRVAASGGVESSLHDIVFLVTDDDQLAAVQEAWAGYRTQALANDRPVGPDLLGIRDEVYALADMLLLREVTPPLAVGVLGGWGSGKSFVMHLLRERMDDVRSEVIAPGAGWDDTAASPFVGHIYPIDFNAWTFARADLWAALMQRVLSELDRQVGIERRLVGKDRLLDGQEWRRLTSTPAALHALYEATADLDVSRPSLFATLREVHQADREQLKTATKDLDDRRDELATAESEIAEKVEADLADQAAKAVEANALEPLADVVAATTDQVWAWLGARSPEVIKATEGAKMTVGELRALEADLRELRPPTSAVARAVVTKYRGLALGLAAVLVLAGLVLAFGDGVGRFAAAVAAVLTTAGVWLERGRALVATFREKALETRARVAEEISAIEATKDADIERERQSSEDLEQKQQAVAQAENRVQHLSDRVGLVAQYQSVGDLVRARLEEHTYTERLGVMQQISDDLVSLSNSMVVAHDDPYEREKQELFPRGPARVVLFIDDLDRCPPRKVVEVLEAVQLLLTTDLFVVVLALDVRYVTKALERVYQGVLSADGDPSGLDYLEKIIQVPYRTRRPAGVGAFQFVAGQMRVADEDGDASGPPAGSSEVATTTASSDGPVPGAGVVTVRDLLFTNDDLVVVAGCCEQLELTPRAGKRVINTLKLYRLVLARRGRSQPDVDDIGTVALLAGVAAAHPEVQRDALAVLERLVVDRAERQTTVRDALARLEAPVGTEEDPEVRRYERWRTRLDALAAHPVTVGGPSERRDLVIGDATLDASAEAIAFVAAFCFVGDDLPRVSAAARP